MSNFATYEQLLEISNKISKKVPQGIMLGNTQVGHIEWQMYLQRDYLKLDGTPLANASNDYSELLKFAQDNSLITSDTTDKSLFKYDSGTDVLTLPDYIDLVLQGGNTIEEKEAGLPNIKGTLWMNNGIGADAYDGAAAFSAGSSGSSSAKITTSGSATREIIYFNANKSNSIYSDSVNTVQPPAITLIPQIKYIKGTTVWEELDFNKLMPLGTVINFMGTTAPEYYLVCDGTVYNINNYTILANFFEEQFGSVNYFGGDGTTTFAVPDLRGEFLRGTGTNSHTNQGSGASVGIHQDGTEHVNVMVTGGNAFVIAGRPTSNIYSDKLDNKLDGGKSQNKYVAIADGIDTYQDYQKYTSRPTNTSVLYCIKYK